MVTTDRFRRVRYPLQEQQTVQQVEALASSMTTNYSTIVSFQNSLSTALSAVVASGGVNPNSTYVSTLSSQLISLSSSLTLDNQDLLSLSTALSASNRNDSVLVTSVSVLVSQISAAISGNASNTDNINNLLNYFNSTISAIDTSVNSNTNLNTNLSTSLSANVQETTNVSESVNTINSAVSTIGVKLNSTELLLTSISSVVNGLNTGVGTGVSQSLSTLASELSSLASGETGQESLIISVSGNLSDLSTSISGLASQSTTFNTTVLSLSTALSSNLSEVVSLSSGATVALSSIESLSTSIYINSESLSTVAEIVLETSSMSTASATVFASEISTVVSTNTALFNEVSSLSTAITEIAGSNGTSTYDSFTNADVVSFTFGTPVYSVGSTNVKLATPTFIGKTVIALYADNHITDPGGSANFVIDGPLIGTLLQWQGITGSANGLVPGARYYLDVFNPGMITTYVNPIGAPPGSYIVQIGRAVSTTEMVFQIQAPIRIS